MIELKHHSYHLSFFLYKPHHTTLHPHQFNQTHLFHCLSTKQRHRRTVTPIPLTLQRKAFIFSLYFEELAIIMVEKEDLGLSLSLSFPQNNHSLQLNLRPSLLPSSAASSGFNLPKPSWNEAAFPSSGASPIFLYRFFFVP